MDEEERRFYMYRIDHLTGTLRVLELQKAQLGIYTPANIQVEIENIKRDIRAYEGIFRAASTEQLAPPDSSESHQAHRFFRYIRHRRKLTERKRNRTRLKQPFSSKHVLYVETLSEENPSRHFLFHFRNNRSQNIVARTIHEKTLDTIALMLLVRSIEHFWPTGQVQLGNQGLEGFRESLRAAAQQSNIPKPPPDAVDTQNLRQTYAALFTALQHTVLPPVEPASDQSNDQFDELLISLTEAWIQLPHEEGVFKCIDILYAFPIVSRSRLLRALDIMTPAICLFHPSIVDEIAAVAQRIVDLFP